MAGGEVLFWAAGVVGKRRTTGTSPVARDLLRRYELRTFIAVKRRCTIRLTHIT